MSKDYAQIAYQYCIDALNDTLPNRTASKLEKLACKRHLDDLAKQNDPNYPYYFDAKKGNRHCRFLERLRHVKGKWKGQLFQLEPHQTFAHCTLFGWLKKKNGFRRFTKVYWELPRKNGKALALDTLIPTPNGWTTMGDIKVGDVVFDENGNQCNVTAVTEVMENRPCYGVTFSNGEKVIADEQHEWLTTARVNMVGVRAGRSMKRYAKPSLVRRKCGSQTREYWYANLYKKTVYIGSTDLITEDQALSVLEELAEMDMKEHPVEVDNLTRIRTTKEIYETLLYSKRQDTNHSIELAKPIQCVDVELPIAPYTFGAWLGDGNSNSAAITCGDNDVEHAESQILKDGYYVSKRRDKTAWRLIISTQIDGEPVSTQHTDNLTRILSKVGVKKNKHIPDVYLRASFKQRLALLQGLMDTDGTVNTKGDVFQFVSIHKKLADSFGELLATMGIKYSIIGKPMRCNGVSVPGTCYSVQFNAFKCELPVFTLPRKLARMRNIADLKTKPRSKTVQITGCVPVPSVPVRCITVDSPSHLYLFGKTMLPTHNSFSAAGIGLYMAFVDKPNDSAEVYAGATTEAQARMVFAPAYEMCKNDEDLREAFGLSLTGTSKNPTSIFRQSDMSLFMPVVGKPGDGANVSCGICDEYHEHATSSLLDTFSTGTGSRDEPLIVIITTAGFDLSSPCYNEHLDCIKILEGTIQMDNVHCMIFGVDNTDDWTDFSVWRKANPNYMVSITEDSLLESYNTAMTSLKDRPAILTKRLNVWQNSGTCWMDLQKWEACKNENLRLEDFKGHECWLGVDLASKIDLCAVTLLFKLPSGEKITECPNCGQKVVKRDDLFICQNNVDDKGCTWERKTTFKVAAFGKYYLPSETCDKSENTHYQLWRDEGILTVTEGARTDFREIEKDIKALSKYFNIKELAFDQREAGYLISSIQEWASFECIEFPQSPQLISAPMKELEAMIYAKDFIHSGDKLLTWTMGNVIKKQSKSGGSTKYYFPAKQKDSDKIDPVVSIIMSLGRLMVAEDTSGAYASRVARGEEQILRVL